MNYWLDYKEPQDIPDGEYSIDFYIFQTGISQYYKEKLRSLSPEEMIQFDDEYINQGANSQLLDAVTYSVSKNDKNTVSYLESLGYEFQ